MYPFEKFANERQATPSKVSVVNRRVCDSLETARMNIVFPFDPQKAAESATEFMRLAGGEISVLKLVKLMYLLDRESLEEVGVPVVGGRYVSMQHGPVTSEVLDAINGRPNQTHDAWNEFISDRIHHCVKLREGAPSTEHLSPYEIRLIHTIHKQHERRDQFQLRDWCHDNCAEWVSPKTGEHGSLPIVTEALAPEIHRPIGDLEDAIKESAFMADVLA